jgi:hypothetical protein
MDGHMDAPKTATTYACMQRAVIIVIILVLIDLLLVTSSRSTIEINPI